MYDISALVALAQSPSPLLGAAALAHLFFFMRCRSQYGCGSCGPRGFYGTIDVHMKVRLCVCVYDVAAVCVVCCVRRKSLHRVRQYGMVWYDIR